MSDTLRKCRVCGGLGYFRCECWPGDCICGQDEDTCFKCEGEGLIEQIWDDDFGVSFDEPEPPSPEPGAAEEITQLKAGDK